MKDILKEPRGERVQEVTAAEGIFGPGFDGQGGFHWGRGSGPTIIEDFLCMECFIYIVVQNPGDNPGKRVLP